MRDGYQKIKAAGAAELIAMSSDNTNGIRALRDDEGIEYLLLSAENLQAINDYNVVEQDTPFLARPATFVINENGRIAWVDLGDRYGHRTNSDQIIDALIDQ